MNQEQWQRVKSVAGAALSHPEATRDEYVSGLCEGDVGLEREVRSLLSSALLASELFEVPAFSTRGATVALDDATRPMSMRPGARIGSYRVIREIGRGGMGTVFLAERADDEYRQQVAVKIVHDARSPEILNWFRDERQILATLDHPNIARLMDGGTTLDGLPYLVMEYVEGVPLDEYCTANQPDLSQRLRLFRQICSAVAYAHRSLVVHRDLKPRNILVANGVPKLLDFGIAKLMDPRAEESSSAARSGPNTGLALLTPEYASPEQVRCEPVTTATDVYALGVILYTLLTDRSPYRLESNAAHELAAAICEQEPVRPSASAQRRPLRRQLSGDLDTLVLTALKKDPRARYATAAQLGDDVDRYLDGRPLTARDDSVAYRTGKFLSRHKVGAAAALLILLALVGGLAATLWQVRQTELQRARAQRLFDEVRTLASSLIFEVHDGIENLPGAIATRQLVVKRALEYFDRLAAEETDNPALQREIASAYDRLASLLGRPYSANLGDSKAALATYRKAFVIREALAGRSNDRQTRLDLWSSYLNIGSLLAETAATGDALNYQRTADEILTGLLDTYPEDWELLRASARTSIARAHLFEQTGLIADALTMARKALAIDERLLARKPSDDQVFSDVAADYGRVGVGLGKLGDPQTALVHLRKKLSLVERLVARQPVNVAVRRNLSTAHLQLGQAILRSGDLPGAVREMRTALAIREAIADRDPTNRQAVIDVMYGRLELGQALTEAGSPSEAAGQFRAALVVCEALAASDPDYVFYRLSLALALSRVSQNLAGTGQLDEGTRLASRAIEILEHAAGADPTDARVQFELAMAYAAAGDIVSLSKSHAVSIGGEASRSAGWWYQRSLTILATLRDTGRLAGGTLNGGEPAKLTEIQHKLSSSTR